MPERPGPPRLIPTYQMDKPWTDPTTPEEDAQLAELALLSGAAPNDRAVTQLFGQFSGDYVINLGKATG